MKFILRLLIGVILLCIVSSFNIVKIHPLHVPINFAKEKDIHETILSVKLNDDEIDYKFMLHISDYDLKYDRELLEDAWKYCQDGKVTRDWRVNEEYYYSCCQYSNHSKQIYSYSCPVPPFPNRDFLVDLSSDDIFPVYIKQFSNHSLTEWEYTQYNIEYIQTEKIFKTCHDLILWGVFVWSILCAIHIITSYINKWSNKYERVFTVSHILLTGFVLNYEISIFQQVPSSNQKDIFLFSILNTFYSLFLIYIPHHKDPDDPHSVEQRIPIEDIVFSFSLKILKHPITKQICSLFYITSFIFEIISIYFFSDFLRETYNLEFEILIIISTFKFIFKIIFLVGFLTAIYEVHVPVQINHDTGQLLQILPDSHYDRVISSFINNKKVKPEKENQNKILGVYDTKIKQIVPFQNTFLNGEIIGFQNVNIDNYTGILWPIGKIKKNKIEIYDSINKFKVYFLNIGYGHVFLPEQIDTNKNIIVYEHINDKLVRLGRIKDKFFFRDHYFLVSLITFIFKMIPEYVEDDYDVNVVEILRHTFHSFTKNIGIVYGYLYWGLFTTSIIIFYVYVIFFHNYTHILFVILQLIMLSVLSIFCINSGLYVKHDYENGLSEQTTSKNIYRGELEIHTQYVTKDLSHLLHMNYTKARNYLQTQFPMIQIEISPDNIPVLNDYNSNRIYLFYDESTNLISKTPYIG